MLRMRPIQICSSGPHQELQACSANAEQISACWRECVNRTLGGSLVARAIRRPANDLRSDSKRWASLTIDAGRIPVGWLTRILAITMNDRTLTTTRARNAGTE